MPIFEVYGERMNQNFEGVQHTVRTRTSKWKAGHRENISTCRSDEQSNPYRLTTAETKAGFEDKLFRHGARPDVQQTRSRQPYYFCRKESVLHRAHSSSSCVELTQAAVCRVAPVVVAKLAVCALVTEPLRVMYR